MPQEIDPRLQKLAFLQKLLGDDEPSRTSQNNLADVQGLEHLYGIQEKQQMNPALLAKMTAETDYTKAHGDYLKQNSEERPEERQAKGVALKASALQSLFQAGLPKEAIEAQAREWGMLPAPAEKPKPMDERTGGNGNPTPVPSGPPTRATALRDDIYGLGQDIGRDVSAPVTYLPRLAHNYLSTPVDQPVTPIPFIPPKGNYWDKPQKRQSTTW